MKTDDAVHPGPRRGPRWAVALAGGAAAVLALLAFGPGAGVAHRDAPGQPKGSYRVTLKAVEIILERTAITNVGTPDEQAAREANQEELEELNGYDLFVVTTTTADTHATQTAIDGLYEVKFRNVRTRSVHPQTKIRINTQVFAHSDCTPDEPVATEAQAVLVPRSKGDDELPNRHLPGLINDLLEDEKQGVVINEDANKPGSTKKQREARKINRAINKALKADRGIELPEAKGPLRPNLAAPLFDDLVGGDRQFKLEEGGTTTGLFVHYLFQYTYRDATRKCPASTTAPPPGGGRVQCGVTTTYIGPITDNQGRRFSDPSFQTDLSCDANVEKVTFALEGRSIKTCMDHAGNRCQIGTTKTANDSAIFTMPVPRGQSASYSVSTDPEVQRGTSVNVKIETDAGDAAVDQVM